MYRIDSINSVSGHFSDGDYGTGRKGTKVPAHWLNAVQGELCNFVTANGIALNKCDNGQVLKALEKKIKGYFDKSVSTGSASGNELFTGYEIDPLYLNPGAILDFSLTVFQTAFGGAAPDIYVDIYSGTTQEKRFTIKIDVNVDVMFRRFCYQNNSNAGKYYKLRLSSDLDNPYVVHVYGIDNYNG